VKRVVERGLQTQGYTRLIRHILDKTVNNCPSQLQPFSTIGWTEGELSSPHDQQP